MSTGLPDDELAERLGIRLARLWANDPGQARATETRARVLTALGAAGRGRRWRWVQAVAAVAILVAAVGVVSTSQDALPGDPTYSVKLGLERIGLAVAHSPEDETKAWLDIAETRLEEIVRAEAEGRYGVLPELEERYLTAMGSVRASIAAVPRTDAGGEVRAFARREVDTHEQVLRGLLRVTPPQARAGLQRALEASRRSGEQPDESSGRVPQPFRPGGAVQGRQHSAFGGSEEAMRHVLLVGAASGVLGAALVAAPATLGQAAAGPARAGCDDPPVLSSVTGVLDRSGQTWRVRSIEVDFGPAWYLRDTRSKRDYDGDGARETYFREFDGLVGTSVTLRVDRAGRGGDRDVYVVNGIRYRKADGCPPPWAGGPRGERPTPGYPAEH